MTNLTPTRLSEIVNAACRAAPRSKVPQFFRCGCCECFHSVDFFGDCRDDSERFAMDELDDALGSFSWEEIEQPE